jgi:hypothetical protein
MTGLEKETGNDGILTCEELREEILKSSSPETRWEDEETSDVFFGSANEDEGFEEDDDFEDEFDEEIDDKEILDEDFDFEEDEDDLFDDDEDPQYN